METGNKQLRNKPNRTDLVFWGAFKDKNLSWKEQIKYNENKIPYLLKRTPMLRAPPSN